MMRIAGIVLIGIGVVLFAKEALPMLNLVWPIVFIFAGIIIAKSGHHFKSGSGCCGGKCGGSCGKGDHKCEGGTCNVCK